MSAITYAVWAFTAGALIPLMAILNGGLARATGGAIQATVLLFAIGLLASFSVAVATRAGLPAVHVLARIPLPQYAGGIIVAFYILSITLIAPGFGVGNAILFVVTAQLLTAALLDHFALAGAAPRPLTSLRAFGLLIVIIGVIVTQISDRMTASAR